MSPHHIISVHKLRYKARQKEQRLQELLGLMHDFEHDVYAFEQANRTVPEPLKLDLLGVSKALSDEGVPDWAKGVKVIHAGRFQHAVVATTNRGH